MTEAREAGVLLATGALTPTTEGVTVRLDDGAFTVSDDHAGGRELIGGWALLEASSTDEAVGWAKRLLAIVGGGESVPSTDPPVSRPLSFGPRPALARPAGGRRPSKWRSRLTPPAPSSERTCS